MKINFIEIVREHLTYDPQTGLFSWSKNNTRVRAGDVAGSVESRGYIHIKLLGKTYKAHRLAWLLTNGEIPSGVVIDHINRVKNDNRIANLRLVTHSENRQNILHARADSNVGLRGVAWKPRYGKYAARITVDRKELHLGFFDDPKDAHNAYVQAKKKYHKAFHYKREAQ